LAEAKIKGVLFDLGETLLTFGKVDTLGLFKEGGQGAYAFLKTRNQPTGSLKCFLKKHLLLVQIYNLWSAIIGRDFDSAKLLRRINEKKGVVLSDEQWQEFAWCWYEPLSRLAAIENDIKETLGRLKDAGIKLGILSNTFINSFSLERHLERLGILDSFDVRLYSYQFPYRKPNKRIFLAAAERLGVLPENTVFVGDRMDTDVAGSRRANMFSVIKRAYTNSKKKIPKNIITIEKIAELPGVIESINHRKPAGSSGEDNVT